MSEFVDYYEVLGVKRDATQDEIKRAYRAKALKNHPNKGGDPEEFKKANEANEVLSHPDQRAAYDEKYDDYREWLEELEPWNTDTLEDKGYMWDLMPENLLEALELSEDEE